MKGVSLVAAALALALLAPPSTAQAASGIVVLHRPFGPHDRFAPLDRPRRDHRPRLGVEADSSPSGPQPDIAAAPPPAFAPEVYQPEIYQPASYEPASAPVLPGPRILYIGRAEEPPGVGPRVIYGDAYSPLSPRGPSVIYGDEAAPRIAAGPKLVYGDAPAKPQPSGPKVIYADPTP